MFLTIASWTGHVSRHGYSKMSPIRIGMLTSRWIRESLNGSHIWGVSANRSPSTNARHGNPCVTLTFWSG